MKYYELNDKICNTFSNLKAKILVKNQIYDIKNLEIDVENKNIIIVYGFSSYNVNIGTIKDLKGIDYYTLCVKNYNDDDNIIIVDNIRFEINDDYILLKID